jgi:hypothetical protein
MKQLCLLVRLICGKLEIRVINDDLRDYSTAFLRTASVFHYKLVTIYNYSITQNSSVFPVLVPVIM